jgi:hypothetical protein
LKAGEAPTVAALGEGVTGFTIRCGVECGLDDLRAGRFDGAAMVIP